MPLKHLLQKNTAYFIPVFISLITGIVFLSLYSKDVLHLTQNGWHTPFFDVFFKYATHLGDGLIFVFAVPPLIFLRWRYALGLIIAGLLTLLLTGLFKQVIFDGEPRPAKYFEGKQELRLVEGVEMHHQHSLPSGHTTTAFACFGFLALIFRNSGLKFLAFSLAVIVAYSRIYLSQHFLLDVVAGGFLGTFIAVMSYYIMQWINWPAEEARLRLKNS